MTLGPLDSPGQSARLKILDQITSAKSLFLCKATYSQVLGVRTWRLWGTIILLPVMISR